MLKGCPFFGVPQVLVRAGFLSRLKPSAVGLYIALLHESERYSTRELVRTDAALYQLSGISSRSLRDARIKLQEFRLIRYDFTAKGHVYTICDPRTGQAFPGAPRDKESLPGNAGHGTGVSQPPAEVVQSIIPHIFSTE